MSVDIFKTLGNTGRDGATRLYFVTLLPDENCKPMLQIRDYEGGAKLEMTRSDALRIADVLREWVQESALK